MSCLDRGLLEALLLMSHSVYKPQLERFLTSYINNWRWAIMGILKGSRERNWRKCRCLCMARNELTMFVVLLGSQMKAPWEVWLWAHSKIWCNRRPHPWSHKHGYTWRKMAVREGSTLGSYLLWLFLPSWENFSQWEVCFYVRISSNLEEARASLLKRTCFKREESWMENKLKFLWKSECGKEYDSNFPV